MQNVSAAWPCSMILIASALMVRGTALTAMF